MNSKNDFIKGDSHRFGQRVSFLSSDKVIKKPREATLEFLFLDQKSPLVKYKNLLGLEFHSTIQSISPNESSVENLTSYIIADEEIEYFADELFILAGKFLATATLFGLNDLHVENILFIKKNETIALAPVDLEIIFYHFISSAETCLLPSPKADQFTCGYAKLMPHLSAKRIQLLTDSFLESYSNIETIFPELLAILETELADSKIRMLLRPTQLYSNYLKQKDEALFASEPIGLSNEEKVQLDFGDIPYFFSFYQSPEQLYYYSSPSEIAKAETIKLHPSIKRHLKQKEMMNNPEFVLKLKVQSLCHTLYYLTENLPQKELEISGINFKCARQKNNLKIELVGNQITLNF